MMLFSHTFPVYVTYIYWTRPWPHICLQLSLYLNNGKVALFMMSDYIYCDILALQWLNYPSKNPFVSLSYVQMFDGIVGIHNFLLFSNYFISCTCYLWLEKTSILHDYFTTFVIENIVLRAKFKNGHCMRFTLWNWSLPQQDVIIFTGDDYDSLFPSNFLREYLLIWIFKISHVYAVYFLFMLFVIVTCLFIPSH